MILLTMTILATALAATTSVMAWRLARREARRSDARVAALASAIYGPEGPVSAETSAAIASFPSEYSAGLAAGGPPASLSGHRFFLASASAAALVVTGLLIFAATRPRGGTAHQGGGPGLSETSAATATPTRPSAQTAAPLELIALSHERAKDTLIVRGALRNPPNGIACDMPVVVVLTFDERGIFLGSSESDESGESLRPGARATFTVSIPARTTSPARYKVSFRSAGRVVPHVDKRASDAATSRGDSAPSSLRQAWPAAPVQS
jgi:hypothetical protein